MVGVWCLNVMELTVFLVWWGKDRFKKSSDKSSYKVNVFFSWFLSIWCDQKTVCTYTKKPHILLTSKSFTMRGASDSCMGLAWRWCGASVFCGRTKRTSHHPTIFARMIGGWICLYSRNAVFYIMDDVIMDDATCLWGTSIWYVVSRILTSPDDKRECFLRFGMFIACTRTV